MAIVGWSTLQVSKVILVNGRVVVTCIEAFYITCS